MMMSGTFLYVPQIFGVKLTFAEVNLVSVNIHIFLRSFRELKID